MEKSPARNSSITRIAQGISSGIGNFLKRSSSKGPGSKTSEGAPPTGKYQNTSSKINLATLGNSTDATSMSAYGMGMTPSSALKSSGIPTQLSDMKTAFKKAGSVRSGSGAGSVIGSTTSDIERLDRLMR